jgi:hypothetical protein
MGKQVAHATGLIVRPHGLKAHPTIRSRPSAGDNLNRFLDCARNDIFGGHGPAYRNEAALCVAALVPLRDLVREG